MAARESHPHLSLFDPARKWKYLIIGTFPPNSALREKYYIDYFYGNKGFLWKIIHDIYHDRGYDFFKGTAAENLEEIKRWQNDYCVGISDTILKCRRKHPSSSDDSDLIDIEYNFGLKNYVLENRAHLEKIIFTSTSGVNSAFKNFRIIMGEDLKRIEDKVITGLPSPSGAGNITFFNTNKEEILGLTNDFYQYVKNLRPDLLPDLEKRWELKKLKQLEKPALRGEVFIPPSPKGLVTEYKRWKYSEVLPKNKCS